MVRHPHPEGRLRRAVRLVCAAAVLAAPLTAPLTVLPAGPASAVVPPADTTVTVGVNTAANVAPGDELVARTSSPVSTSGIRMNFITHTWDPAAAEVVPDSVVAPQGWPVQYRTSNAWTSTVPSSPSALAATDGVRTAATLVSGGLDGAGKQVVTSQGTGTLKTSVGSLSSSGGGDGWDVFFSGTRVFNVYHHSTASYQLDCHELSDGSSCLDSVYTVSPYMTSGASSGTVRGGKAYSVVITGDEDAWTDAGVICTDVSGPTFTSCGFTSLLSGSFSAYSKLGGQTRAGNEVYGMVEDGAAGKLLCYDLAAATPCTGQPYTIPGYSSFDGSIPAHLATIAGRVYVTSNQVSCFDPATHTFCTGSWPVGSGMDSPASVVPKRNPGTLAVNGVCLIDQGTDCWDLTGASVTTPSGLATMLGNESASSMGSWSSFQGSAGRAYWVDGNLGKAWCYDWATDGPCPGYTPPVIGGDAYTTTVDPRDDRCMWTNSDGSGIKTFNGLTGSLGCPPPVNPTVSFGQGPATVRLSCTEAGRVRSWRTAHLTPAGALALADLRLTVVDPDGTPVAGYTDLTPNGSGIIDLTGLAVADSGLTPTFEVTAVGGTDGDAVQVETAITYVADPAQLCVPLTVLQPACPSLTPGVQGNGTAAVTATTVTGTTLVDDGVAPVTRTRNVSVTRAGRTGCIGAVSGTISRDDPGGPVPAGSVTVSLRPSGGGTAYATVTTDGSGNYAFPYVKPGSYLVTVAGASGSATVTTSTVDVDLLMPPTPLDPSATPVTVDPGVVANVPLTGVPDGSTVGGPSTVSGKASSVTYSGTQITVTPVARFAGLIAIPFTVTRSAETAERTAYVRVRPAVATRVRYQVGYVGGFPATTVTWVRSTSLGALKYEVWVNGVKTCVTTTTGCVVRKVLGPKANVDVVAVTADGTRSRLADGVYTARAGCGGVAAVYFENDSAVLTRDARGGLAVAAAMLRAQGFTKVCLVGFTDANGSSAYNLALSKKRVNAVGAFLDPRLPATVRITKDYSGEADPAAPNDTSDGRAANRRVEIRVG